MTLVEKIENLHWKFPNEDKLKPLKKYRDFELNKIRAMVRNNRNITEKWFSISSDKWYEDVTYLLKHRKKTREIKSQMK